MEPLHHLLMKLRASESFPRSPPSYTNSYLFTGFLVIKKKKKSHGLLPNMPEQFQFWLKTDTKYQKKTHSREPRRTHLLCPAEAKRQHSTWRALSPGLPGPCLVTSSTITPLFSREVFCTLLQQQLPAGLLDLSVLMKLGPGLLVLFPFSAPVAHASLKT